MTLRAGPVFVALVWAAGLATGLVLASAPRLLPVPMPYFVVPLGVGLLVDLLLKLGSRFAAAPVSGGERAVGVLGGAVIAFALAGARSGVTP